MAITPALAMAHVGVTVPNIEAAIEWYQDVFGFRPLGPPAEIDLTVDTPFTAFSLDILGSGVKKFRIAHLTTANGTALELFEWVDPPTEIPENNFQYRQQGLWHFAVVHPDVDALARRIEETGGKVRTKIWDLIEGQPYRFFYAEDPFGTIIEVYSHSHEQFFANQG